MGKRKTHKHDKRNSKRRVADDDAASEDIHDTGFAAKIVRQQKFLRAKFGGVEDEMHEDEDEAVEEQKTVWGGRKSKYYGADNRDFEIQSSDDEWLAEEEEVIRLQKERAKTLSLEDFGLEDESDWQLTRESNANAGSENVDELKEKKKKEGKRKQGDNQMGGQSMEMLKLRALLDKKIKQKDFTLIEPKQDGTKKHLLPIKRKLEASDDFSDDDAQAAKRKGQDNYASAADLSRLVAAKRKKSKVVSGDDDFPTRYDIGERRRRYELQMMARAGIESKNDTSVVESDSDGDNGAIKGNGQSDSEDEFYKQVKQQRAAKRAAKTEIYSRTMTIPSSPETVRIRRKISYEMEKNRGLIRHRKKLTKNPRKKYKLKFKDAANRRKGQVREVNQAIHPYGGEATGINPGISRSIRFKN